MERKGDMLVSPTVEVPVIEGELVTAIRTPADRGGRGIAIASTGGARRRCRLARMA